MRGAPAVLCALAVTLSAASALAQPAPTAAIEAEHRRGLALFREHRDAEARAIFRGIVERTREPRALTRLAATEAALGEWVAAEEHLRAALDARNDPWILANRAGADGGLEGDLRRYASHVGRVEVLCPTPGAEVWMHGARVATLPMSEPLRVAAGTVTFEIRAPGHIPELRHESVTGGPDALVRVSLTLSPAPPSRDVPTVTPPVRDAPAPSPPPRVAPVVASGRGAWWALGITAAGVGVVGLGVGVAGLLLRNGHATAFNDNPLCGVQNGVVVGGSNCQSDYDAGAPLQAMSTAGFIAGGALLATGVTVLLVGTLSRRERPATITLTGAPGDVGVGLRAAF